MIMKDSCLLLRTAIDGLYIMHLSEHSYRFKETYGHLIKEVTVQLCLKLVASGLILAKGTPVNPTTKIGA